LPEGRIILSEATIYLASAPKSNSAYKAIDAAMSAVEGGEPNTTSETLHELICMPGLKGF
ncbi:AAA family ATPase, partial [Acetomicrobium sp. S15 = DSM 107314]|uniref:AAA family ATPase n=1 Tax=Acetomicrobium sp. S15 = DSM 107314 TaxID=2529858 RepID=UPI00406D0343